MATDTNASYAALVAEAEAAVAAVKDPELRRVAFEKILATLLDAGANSAASTSPKAKIERSKGGHAREAAVSKMKAKLGPKGRVEALIDDGFFAKQKTIAQVKAELADRGHHIPLTSLSGPLQRLTQARRLRRQQLASSKKGAKTTYAYSNW